MKCANFNLIFAQVAVARGTSLGKTIQSIDALAPVIFDGSAFRCFASASLHTKHGESRTDMMRMVKSIRSVISRPGETILKVVHAIC
ncbi:MAG: hypothetical protein EBU34_13110, partial [Alphaproteobacteria bacterium]|nr:hypothetical protein [Alphaproteobacteria bacterium]